MKAVICTKYGPPEVLQLQEVSKPTPGDNELLVRIHATTVTAGDCRMRGFNVPASYWLPAKLALGFTKPRKKILGMEFAGEVEAVGKKVKLFKKGDQIFAAHIFGAYAEYVCIPEKGMVATKPYNLTWEESAAVPVGAITAMYFLKSAKIKEGQKVLIYGASGSVGSYAVQIARYFGAVITGICSTANLDLVKSLGADKVIDYTKEDFTNNGETYDVIFDAVGKSSYSDCINSLTQDGTYLHAVATPDISLRMLWTRISSSKKTIGGGASNNNKDITLIKELIEERKIKPVIDRKYSLDEIVEAHRYVDKGHKKGNVVITM